MTPTKSPKQLDAFISTVLHFYKEHKRSMPWRETRDPYSIMVSEIMLQQTQVDRVVPKYLAFLKKFPTAKSLANASVADVLKLWQGLGYNRRALFLHRAAKTIFEKYGGEVPKKFSELVELPGIGPATASAILAYAHNEPAVFVETNVRTVYLHHFFKRISKVSDEKLSKLVARTVDIKNPREWYYALMDYGTFLKKTVGNPNTRSKHYVKQAPFKGSDREVRGFVLRALSRKTKFSESALVVESTFEKSRIKDALKKLEAEGFIKKQGNTFTLIS